MKSNWKKRMLAVVLCMVIALSNSSFIFASSGTEEPAAVAQEGDPQNVQEAQTEAAVQDTPAVLSETTPEATPEATPEPTQVPEMTAAPTEAPQATAEPTQAPEVTAAPEATPAPTETPAVTAEPTQAPEVTAAPEATPAPTEAPVDEVQQTEPQPYHAVYEDNTITITVSAEAGVIPEGAELKVTPIEKKEITSGMTEEEKAEAEAVNHQYDLTEKKLTEDSEANDTMMQGFLAYDISFLVNGQETEPNGDVKVVMDFKEAAVPEGVSEDADVAVKHLREEAIAEDGVIVEDITEKAQLEATEKAEIEKVELISDSFSIFTIKWETNKGALKVRVVDANGHSLGQDGSYTFEYEADEDRVKVEDIAGIIKEKSAINEKFKKAVYVKDGDEFSFTATQVCGLYYNSNEGFRYTRDEKLESGWTNVQDGIIYFIFGDDPEVEIPSYTTVPTVSTKEKGIKINLFDYQVGLNGEEAVDLSNSDDPRLNQGINLGHILKFVSSKGSGNQNINIWQVGSSGRLNQDMVQSKLHGGFPIIDDEKPGATEAESLAYLFNTEPIENAKSVYEDRDYLFQKDKKGYYIYDSNEYYAYLQKNSDGTFADSFTAINAEKVGFYPFTEPQYISDGIKDASKDAVLGSTGVNHYFGMDISAGFIQPEDGMIQNEDGTSTETPMVFEFSGDDDVWVFIDDVLVLDLGGIHAAVSGKIDFSTGNIYIKDVKDTEYEKDGTIKEKFENAGKYEANNFSNNTFTNYSSHTIKFFYLERGNSDSNCLIKFNFPTIPENSVTVAKEVVNKDGVTVDYAEDIDFQFNIKKQMNGNLVDYRDEEYTIFQGSEKIGTGKTDGDGNFTLKHGQMAVFEGFLATDQYQVTETGAYLNGYDVKYNGEEISLEKEDGSDQTIYSASTGTLTAGMDRTVVFKNSISATTELQIEKVYSDPENTDNKDFQIKILFEGKLYNGTYQLTGESGPQTASDGIISLKAGQTATITGFFPKLVDLIIILI